MSSLACGLVGLPNAGKSTLFNALTKVRALVGRYPFTTIDPNVGVVPVPDFRLDQIAKIVKPKRVVPATIEFVDVAGLVKGASRGEGLGNQFLGHIRNVDAIIMVVRLFEDPEVPHVYGQVDPGRDIQLLIVELCLADLAVLTRWMERRAPAAKAGDKTAKEEIELGQTLEEELNQGKLLRFTFADKTAGDGILPGDLAQALLTVKPIMYIANVDERELAALTLGESDSSPLWQNRKEMEKIAERTGGQVVVIAARLEEELGELEEAEAEEYLHSLGVKESGLTKLVHTSYNLLDLITFFTATGQEEVRAWTLKRGTKAPQAAGKVHSDMERGFIRAEVIAAEKLVEAGSYTKARELGWIRLEGRDYVVQDGDVVHFRFSV